LPSDGSMINKFLLTENDLNALGKLMSNAREESVKELIDMGLSEANVRWAARILSNQEQVALGILANFWNAQSATQTGYPGNTHKESLLATVHIDKYEKIDQCVVEFLKTLEVYLPDVNKAVQTNQQLLENLKQIVRTAAAEEFWLSKELSDKPKEEQVKTLQKLLTPIQILDIQNGLKIPTFTMKISGNKNIYHASFTRDGQKFRDTIALNSSEEVLAASWIQWGSIFLEVVLFIISCIGIRTSLTASQTAKIAEDASQEIASSGVLQQACAKFKEAWNTNVGDFDRAKEIFKFLKNVHSASSILHQTIKAIIDTMSWWKRAEAFALVAAQITAAFLTDGAALIAKILLALHSAYTFGKKLKNLSELDDILSRFEEHESELRIA